MNKNVKQAPLDNLFELPAGGLYQKEVLFREDAFILPLIFDSGATDIIATIENISTGESWTIEPIEIFLISTTILSLCEFYTKYFIKGGQRLKLTFQNNGTTPFSVTKLALFYYYAKDVDEKLRKISPRFYRSSGTISPDETITKRFSFLPFEKIYMMPPYISGSGTASCYWNIENLVQNTKIFPYDLNASAFYFVGSESSWEMEDPEFNFLLKSNYSTSFTYLMAINLAKEVE